jgi:hypothetical protein
MESALFGGAQQPLAEDLFGRIVGEFEIVDAGVDGRVASGSGIDLSDDGESGVKIGETAGWQRTATGGELQKCFSLFAAHVDEDVDEANEAGAVEETKISVRIPLRA